MNELAALRQAHPQWRIWTSDAGRRYATRIGLVRRGAGITVYGDTPTALTHAIAQAEAAATTPPPPL